MSKNEKLKNVVILLTQI